MKRAPETWQRVLIGVMATFVVGGALVFGYFAGGTYAAMPVVERTRVLRLFGGMLFLASLLAYGTAAYEELFRTGDVSLLLTMPLTDRQRFHRKASRVALHALGVAALPCLPFTTFAYRLHWPLRSFAAVVLAALVMMAATVGISFVIALSRWLRLVLRVLVYLAGVLLIAQIVMLFGAFDESMARMHLVTAWLGVWLGRWWPGVLAADLVRTVAFGSWLPAAIAGAKLLLMVQVTFVVAEVLATFSYRLEDVLREQAASRKRDASEGAVRREGPLARWLRARWSPRTRELLAFIQRREYPEDVGRRLRPLLILLAMFVALIWATLRLANLPGDVFILIIVGLLAFHLLRDVLHVPFAWRRQFIAGRGEHDHPLIETWPVGAREFIHLTWANDFGMLACYFALILVVVAFLPVPFLYGAFVSFGVPWLLLLPVYMTPLQHAFSYHTDLRRRRLLALLHAVLKVTVVFVTFALVSGVLFIANPSAWVASTIAVGFWVIVVVGGGIAAYFIVLARDRTHRFDAEYRYPSTSPFRRRSGSRW